LEYKDYYAVLGVPKDASQDDIQKAYRKLARKHHPDVNKDPGAEAKFKEISEAKEVLGDPEKRKTFDRYGSAYSHARTHGGAPPPGFEDFRFDFGDGGGSSGFDFGGSGFSSFFEMLFGGAGGARGQRAPSWRSAGADHEAHLDLTLEEAAHGGEREIRLADPTQGQSRAYRVKIPRGVRAGQKIRLSGRGGQGSGGGQAGDLYLKVGIAPHPHFRLDDKDLTTRVLVTPWEAALGAEVDVPTLNGPLRVKIPAGSSSGRKIRLRGKGFPAAGGEPGDLLAEIQVVVPESLSEREKQLFEELKETSTFKPRS